VRDDVSVADGAERDDRPPDPGAEGRKVLPIDERDQEPSRQGEGERRKREKGEDAAVGDRTLSPFTPAKAARPPAPPLVCPHANSLASGPADLALGRRLRLRESHFPLMRAI
jgi:hypothetical protein